MGSEREKYLKSHRRTKDAELSQQSPNIQIKTSKHFKHPAFYGPFPKQNKRVAQGKFRVEKPKKEKDGGRERDLIIQKNTKEKTDGFPGTRSFLLKSFFDY